MTRYFLRALRAQLRSSPLLYLLAAAGVALGVASVLCIQVVNRSALAAFEGSVEAVSGGADLSVLGRTPSLPEALYPVVLGTPGVAAAWPLFRASVVLERTTAGAATPDGDGAGAGASGAHPGDRAARPERTYLDVIGLDLFAPTGLPWSGAPGDATRALTDPGWAAFSPELARARGLRVGDRVQVATAARVVTLRVGALVDFRVRTPLASPRLVVMDIAQAQALFGTPGEVQAIDLRVAPGLDPRAVGRRLEARLAARGASVRVLSPAERTSEAKGLLGAFRLNLTALSLVSLFVGLFLVRGSTEAALVRRRPEMGLLRSIGATHGQVLGLALGETALLGIAGTLLGIPLGLGAAASSLRFVSATVTNLYLLERIERLVVPPSLLVLAAAVGLVGALLGGLGPALDLARRDTKALLSTLPVHERARLRARPLALGGALALALSAAAYAGLGPAVRARGFLLAAGLLAAMPLLTPLVVGLVCGLVRPRGFGLGFALRGLGARLRTTSFAVASLAVAVSMLVGITLMVGSFRRTLDVWIASTVHADVYVQASSARRDGAGTGFEPAFVRAVEALPGVVAVDRLRSQLGYTGDRRITVTGVDLDLAGGTKRFSLLPPQGPESIARARREGGVLVSETLARKLGIGPGDRVPLETRAGEVLLPVAAVYYDYASENGSVVMDLDAYARHFGPGEPSAVAIYLADGARGGVSGGVSEARGSAARGASAETDARADATVDRVRALDATGLAQVRSNRELRREALRIFDQTFAVTRLLQAMSLLIAACGITLTLLVLAREQVGEVALFRALGARRAQVFGVYLGKGLGIGLLGLALGIVAGVLLAAVLVLDINRAYFGWTIQPHAAWGAVVFEALTILAAAVIASLYPAWRASRTGAAELARVE